jgi:hypothetical protein
LQNLIFQSPEGVRFQIIFAPTSYLSGPVVGKLVIQTEEMEWLYQVIGRHPNSTQNIGSAFPKQNTIVYKKKLNL